MNRRYVAILVLVFFCAEQATAATFNVRDFGAVGDGKTLETAALNKAISACAAAGGGQVLFPAGKYLSGTLLLKSNVTLMLDAAAEIIGTADLDQYQHFTPPGASPLARYLRWHRALILGIDAQNVTITGRGTVNGNKVFDAQGEEKMRGPHTILMGNCRGVTLRDISIKDAANYAVMLEFTSDVEVRGVKITGGWDGVHFRGWKDKPCRSVTITDCEFYTGDDCIAGWFWEDTLIARCIINSSCNGVRLIGPARNLIIHDCLFFGPGRFEHRTSRDQHRTNMLAGLCLQPGAWDKTEGPLDDVEISNLTMHNVTTPLHLSLKPGNTAGRISVNRLTATGVYRAAASVESWAETPIEQLTLRDVSLSFRGGGTAEQARMQVKAPGVDARPLPAWGLYARNIKKLELQNVRLFLDKDDVRPAVIGENVASLELDLFRFPASTAAPLSLTGVRDLRLRDTAVDVVEGKCTDLKIAAKPFAATVTVENGDQPGVAKVELAVDGKAATQWVWLKAGERKDVVFAQLSAPAAGKHEVSCGQIRREVICR